MSNRIRVLLFNSANVNDREFEDIGNIVRGWGFNPGIYMDQDVYKRFIIGRWLAFTLLKNYGVTRDQFVRMALSNLGKPYLPDHDVSFSISHSHDVVACAVTAVGRIGIDIEQVRPLIWEDYQDCFTLSEWENVVSAPDRERQVLEFWTMKESLLKADGRGLLLPLGDVVIHQDQGNIRQEEKNWYFKRIDIEGYTCHICTEFPGGEVEVIFSEALME